MTYEDEQAFRRLVDERADFHLANWGSWCRRYRVGRGLPRHAVGLSTGGVSGDSAFDDLCEEVDSRSAAVADAVLDGMSWDARNLLEAVYALPVWRLRPSADVAFAKAAAEFWLLAKRRGLM